MTQLKAMTVDATVLEWSYVATPFPAYFGVIDGLQLKTWWNSFGKRLVSSNIRHSLGATDVNMQIRQTAIATPERFWYFNNGITMIAEQATKAPAGAASLARELDRWAGVVVTLHGAGTEIDHPRQFGERTEVNAPDFITRKGDAVSRIMQPREAQLIPRRGVENTMRAGARAHRRSPFLVARESGADTRLGGCDCFLGPLHAWEPSSRHSEANGRSSTPKRTLSVCALPHKRRLEPWARSEPATLHFAAAD